MWLGGPSGVWRAAQGQWLPPGALGVSGCPAKKKIAVSTAWRASSWLARRSEDLMVKRSETGNAGQAASQHAGA